jgi:ubiquinone/menaquinone biosynthesis C-methylase UbiE
MLECNDMDTGKSYLMENLEEILRLEIKTDPEAVRKQARWCGLKPGMRVLDAGCGPGKVTSILYEMIKPKGTILGVDYSESRIEHAAKHYGNGSDIAFQIHDLRDPLDGMGPFDLIWIRFVLEFNLVESFDIVKNLTAVLKPGGYLCLIDLDHNCLNHYEMPCEVEEIIFQAMKLAEHAYNFDPYSGRKLYSYLYDLGYKDIQVDLLAHHLIYGEIGEGDIFNWTKKVEIAFQKVRKLFANYPGGHDAFLIDFKKFLLDPRRFIYTPVVLCKGVNANSP